MAQWTATKHNLTLAEPQSHHSTTMRDLARAVLIYNNNGPAMVDSSRGNFWQSRGKNGEKVIPHS